MAFTGLYFAIIGFIVLIIAIIAYLIKDNFNDNFNVKFSANAPIIIDRRYNLNKKYHLFMLGEIEKIRMKPNKLRLWVKPLDYQIEVDGKIKKIDKSAKTESLLVVDKNNFLLKKDSGNGSIPIYEIISDIADNEYYNKWIEENRKNNILQHQNNDLRAQLGNFETHIINLKALAQINSTLERKTPALTIEQEVKK